MPLWQVVLFTSLLCTVVGIVIGFLLMGISALLVTLESTIGLAVMVILVFLLWPLGMFMELYLTGHYLGMFTMTTIWWQAYLIGLAFGIFQFWAPSSKAKTVDLEPRPRTPEPEFERGLDSSRGAGMINIPPTSPKDTNRCDHCGRGLRPDQDTCDHCGAENMNYRP